MSGKGSRPRPISDRSSYESNFDAIFNISKVLFGIVKSIIKFAFLNACSLLISILTPLIFLLIFLLSVRETNLKLLSYLTDLIICCPIRPMQPVIAKFIFFILND